MIIQLHSPAALSALFSFERSVSVHRISLDAEVLVCRGGDETAAGHVLTRWGAAAYIQLHCGGANSSQKRRVLFYFTASESQRWPLPNGLHGSNSMRAEDRWKYQLCDLGL